MRERPILFSGPMVRALLDGRKTQTRRIMKRGELCKWGSASNDYWAHADFSKAWVDGARGQEEYLHVPCHSADEGECAVCDHWGWAGTSHRLWPMVAPWNSYRALHTEKGYTPPAGKLWVRERGWLAASGMAWMPFEGNDPDIAPVSHDGTPYKPCPSIHMPRWVSRITLEITEVRAQRLQEISEADAKAEGLELLPHRDGEMLWWHAGTPDVPRLTAARAFQDLWESINGEGSWAANPWVWATSFKVVKTYE